MGFPTIRRIFLAFLIVIVLVVTLGLMRGSDEPTHEENVLKLKAPSFVGVANAEGLGFLSSVENEAGISAYVKSPTSIDLNDVRDVFRTIEEETSDYIIGSVPVGNYAELNDVHVYVHTDGWVLAYYLAADPVSKVFDWQAYHDGGQTNLTTKLEITLAVMAVEAGFAFSGGIYYDFRHPNATNLMLIVDYGNDSFEVNLPGSFTYYERSWSLYKVVYGPASYTLDGITIQAWGNVAGPTEDYGALTAAQLLPDQLHEIAITGGDSAYGGLGMVYRIP